MLFCFLFLYSCSAQKQDNFKKISNNFYLNMVNNHVVRKKYFINEINDRFVSDSSFDESIYYYKGDSICKGLLSNFIDIQSIQNIDSQLIYFRDKRNVYYFHASADGGDLYLIRDANQKSFKSICFEFAKDDKSVFYRNDKLNDLVPQETKCLFNKLTPANIFYVKDKKSIYYKSFRIDSADASSFELINGKNADAKDKSFFYLRGKRVVY